MSQYTDSELARKVIGAVDAIQDAHITLTDSARKMNTVAEQVADAPGPNKVPRAGADGKLDAGWSPQVAAEASGVIVLSAPVLGFPSTVAAGGNADLLIGSGSIRLCDIDHFLVTIDGAATPTKIMATENSASYSVTVRNALGESCVVKVVAVDVLGNKSIATEVSATIAQDYIIKPSITSPASSAELFNDCGVIATSSAFSTFSSSDTGTARDSHTATDWRIMSAATGGEVIEENANSTDLTSHTFNTLSLTVGSTYYIQCRYHGASLGWSGWSDPVSFVAKEGALYHGFTLYRHESNEATIIEYKAANGTQKKIAVKDAKFRDGMQFGAVGTEPSQLVYFTAKNKSGGWYPEGLEQIDQSAPMPVTLTNEVIFQQWGSALAADKTAKANCDIWMAYNTRTDTAGIVGVPAVAWCRSQNIGGVPCDLANTYELICIWACGDKLDELDPTASAYPYMKLGYTALGDGVNGRTQKAKGYVISQLWSSTAFASVYTRRVGSTGHTGMYARNDRATAVPILEL